MAARRVSRVFICDHLSIALPWVLVRVLHVRNQRTSRQKVMMGEKSHETLLQQNNPSELLFLLHHEGIKGVRRKRRRIFVPKRKSRMFLSNLCVSMWLSCLWSRKKKNHLVLQWLQNMNLHLEIRVSQTQPCWHSGLGESPVRCGMLNPISGVYSLDANRTCPDFLIVRIRNVTGHWQMSPWCRGKCHSLLKTTALGGLTETRRFRGLLPKLSVGKYTFEKISHLLWTGTFWNTRKMDYLKNKVKKDIKYQ